MHCRYFRYIRKNGESRSSFVPGCFRKIRAEQYNVFQHQYALTENEVKRILSDI